MCFDDCCDLLIYWLSSAEFYSLRTSFFTEGEKWSFWQHIERGNLFDNNNTSVIRQWMYNRLFVGISNIEATEIIYNIPYTLNWIDAVLRTLLNQSDIYVSRTWINWLLGYRGYKLGSNCWFVPHFCASLLNFHVIVRITEELRRIRRNEYPILKLAFKKHNLVGTQNKRVVILFLLLLYKCLSTHETHKEHIRNTLALCVFFRILL